MTDKELKDKIIDSLVEKIKSSDWFDSLIDEVIFNSVVDEAIKDRKNQSAKSNEEIANLFLEKSSQEESECCDDCCSVAHLKYLSKNKGVIDAFLYNEQKESFELYPFRVTLNNNNNIVLVGLRSLEISTWEKCKDKEFKFIFSDEERSYYEILTGHIPSKEEIESIPENLRSIGDWYWTSTSFNTSGAWVVCSGGYVSSYNSVSASYGVVPYIIIPL